MNRTRRSKASADSDKLPENLAISCEWSAKECVLSTADCQARESSFSRAHMSCIHVNLSCKITNASCASVRVNCPWEYFQDTSFTRRPSGSARGSTSLNSPSILTSNAGFGRACSFQCRIDTSRQRIMLDSLKLPSSREINSCALPTRSTRSGIAPEGSGPGLSAVGAAEAGG